MYRACNFLASDVRLQFILSIGIVKKIMIVIATVCGLGAVMGSGGLYYWLTQPDPSIPTAPVLPPTLTHTQFHPLLIQRSEKSLDNIVTTDDVVNEFRKFDVTQLRKTSGPRLFVEEESEFLKELHSACKQKGRS